MIDRRAFIQGTALAILAAPRFAEAHPAAAGRNAAHLASSAT